MKKFFAAIAAQIASFFSAPEKKETSEDKTSNDEKMVLCRLVSVGDKKLQFRSRRTGRILTAKIYRHHPGWFEVKRKGQRFEVGSKETVTVPC